MMTRLPLFSGRRCEPADELKRELRRLSSEHRCGVGTVADAAVLALLRLPEDERRKLLWDAHDARETGEYEPTIEAARG